MRSLPDGIDFLLRPVREHMCSYESLKDGTLTLEDVFLMNAFLDNEYHNRSEVQRYLNHGKHT